MVVGIKLVRGSNRDIEGIAYDNMVVVVVVVLVVDTIVMM